MMTLLILDDEPVVRAGIINLCRQAGDMQVIGEAGLGAKGLQAAERLRPDLLLLDSALPDMSGLDVLRAMRRRSQRRTILLVENEQDGATAFGLGALDYLLKPVNDDEFAASILYARTHLLPRNRMHRRLPPNSASRVAGVDAAPRRPVILIGERAHKLYPLAPQQISYVEAAGNYVKYHVAGTEYIARESIKNLLGLLSDAGFLRIERSILLNIRSIAYVQPVGYGTFAFTLNSGTRLQSGPVYRDTILRTLPLRRRGVVRSTSHGHAASDGLAQLAESRHNTEDEVSTAS